MQIDKSKLEYKRGNVIGIGKMYVPKMPCFGYKLPLMDFVVTKSDDCFKKHISSCIQLQVDGYGDSNEDAQFSMVDHCLYYLTAIFEQPEYCWSSILDLLESNPATDEIWNLYHTFQLMQAEKGYCIDDSVSMRKLLDKMECAEKIAAKTDVPKLTALPDEIKKMFVVEYFAEA